MTVTPEVLLGLLFLLLAVALSLIFVFARGLRRGRAERSPHGLPRRPASADQTDALVAPVQKALAEDTGKLTSAVRSDVQSVKPSHSPSLRAQAGPGRAQPPGATPLMQVWRDADGSLMVEIDGQFYHHLYEVRDRDVGTRLLEIINRLVGFSTDKAARPELPASKPDESALASSLPVGEPAQRLSQRLQRQAEAPPRMSRLTADPVPFRRRSAADEQNITLDLAGEIDQLLQGRIQALPEFSRRYIHVSSAPDGALRFQVDGAHYTAVEDIPEPGVRALLRAAIKDWEAQR